MNIKSEEFFIVEHLKDHSKKIIYVPLRSALFLVSSRTSELLKTPKESKEKTEIINYLKAKPLIDIRRHHEAIMQSPRADLSIAITRDCNLGCIYCFANAGQPGSKSMTEKNIEFITDYFFQNAVDKNPACREISLSFMGGGEPMIRLKLIKFSIDLSRMMAAKRGKILSISTATNGYFNKNVADFIMREFNSISLSFDGPDFIQNIHRPLKRPLKNSSESFKKVFETAKYFQQNKFNFAIRATVSRLTIERYCEVIDFFASEFPGKQIGLESLNPLGRGTTCKIVPTAAEFADGIALMSEYAVGKGVVVHNANIAKFELLKTVFCNAIAAPGFTVTTDGEIWACTRENAPDIFHYGNFDFNKHKVEIDHNRLKGLKEINVFNFPECQECFCKYHCAGDCPDNRFADLLKCNATRLLGVQILNRLIDSNIS